MHSFSFISRVGTILFFLILTTAGFSTHAQEPTAPNPFGNRYDKIGNGLYYPPAVYVDKLKYDLTSGNGSFSILNRSGDAMGDLGYRIEVRGKLPKLQKGETLVADNAPVYWTEIKKEIYALADKDQKNVSFQFTPPSLPKGEYRLRVRVFTSQGQDLGREDVVFTITETAESFALLTAGTLSTAEYGAETFEPQAGPNIKPGEKIALRFMAENLGNKTLNATPTLEIFNTKEKIATQTGKPITLSRNATITSEFELTSPTSPNVYRTELTLRENSTSKVVSSPAEFRFVTRGISGRILSLRADNLKLTDKNELLVSASVVGPADSETSVDGKIEFSVLDEKGEVGTHVAPETLKLTDGVISGKSLVQLTRSIEGNTTLKAVLKTTTGQILDEYKVELEGLKFVSLPVSTEDTPNVVQKDNPPLNYSLLIGIILVVLAIFVALFFLYRKYRKPFNPLLLLVALFSSLATSVFAAGNGIIVHQPLDMGGNIADTADVDWSSGRLGDQPILTLNVIRPWHDQPANTYVKNSVPLDYEFSFAACANAVMKVAFDFHYLREGGKINTLRPYTGQTYEKTAYADTYQLNKCPGGKEYCITASSFQGTLNLANLVENANSTTLRAMMRVGRIISNKEQNPPKQWNETESDYAEWTQKIDWDYRRGAMYASNIWLNFGPPLICTVSPNPTSVSSSPNTTFTVTGGNTTHPLFRFLEGTTVLQESTSDIFTTFFASDGPKTIDVQRCEQQCDLTNLFTNPDFEAGNTGFTSEYTARTGSGCGYLQSIFNPRPKPGEYLVNNNPKTCSANYGSVAGRGKVLIVNTAPTQKSFWCQSVTVQPNQSYAFSVDMKSAIETGTQSSRWQWFINSSTVGPEIQTNATWTNYRYVWDSGTATEATVCGKNVDTGSGTLDLVIDNVSFTNATECSINPSCDQGTCSVQVNPAQPQIEVTVGGVPVSPGDTITFLPDIQVESRSGAKQIAIRNTGTIGVDYQYASPGSTNFEAINNSEDGSLSVGNSTTLGNVVFKPEESGSFEYPISINYRATGSTTYTNFPINFTGTGIATPVTASLEITRAGGRAHTGSTATITKGQSVDLRWEGTGGATSCTSPDFTISDDAVTGTTTQTPPDTKTYSVICTKGTQTASANATVTVVDSISGTDIREL